MRRTPVRSVADIDRDLHELVVQLRLAVDAATYGDTRAADTVERLLGRAGGYPVGLINVALDQRLQLTREVGAVATARS